MSSNDASPTHDAAKCPAGREEMACPMAIRCPMFDDFESASALRIWQINYCEKRYRRCARFKVRETGEIPPPTLRPDGTHAKPR